MNQQTNLDKWSKNSRTNGDCRVVQFAQNSLAFSPNMRVYAWVTSDIHHVATNLSCRNAGTPVSRAPKSIPESFNLVIEWPEYGILVPVRRLFNNKALFYLFIPKVRLPSLP